jgi:Domain of unknown function (DUF5916)
MQKQLISIICTIFIAITIFYFPLSAAQARVNNKQYRVPKVDTPVKTDGVLDEEVWKKALVLQLNYEVQPGENIKPPVRTDVLIAYSTTRLYIAFRAFDPDPSQIRARLSDRDNSDNQDWVAVILDTFNDKRRSFDLLCTPLGIQSDFIEVSGGNGGSWDAIWDSGGKINNKGYFVEMSVPFSSLRFQRVDGDQVWSFDAVRSYPRSVRHHIGIFPRDRSNNCYLCQAVQLIGFEGVKPGKNIEIDPTIATHLTQDREDDTAGPWLNDKSFDPGITGHWGITPNLTLSGTVNPDFSQVEADSLQLDVNSTFALYYSEKRPFFTEGGDYFSSRINAVHTRTIRDPSWGVKLTGKEGSNTIGGYFVRDTLTNLIFPGTESSDSTSLDTDSTNSAFRYRRDLGNNYTIGALFTNRQSGDYFNRVLGIDGDFRFTQKDRVRFQVLTSSTRYSQAVAEEFEQPEGRFNDTALDIVYSRGERNLKMYTGFKTVGRHFRADQGFIPQVGYSSIYSGADYIWYGKPGQWFSRLWLEGDFRYHVDYDGNLMRRVGSLSFNYQGPMQIHSFVEVEAQREAYEGIQFDMANFILHHCMKPFSRMHWYFNFRLGDRIDYANIRKGNRYNIQTGISWDIGMHLHLNLSHTFEDMKVQSQNLYTANQSEMRLTYQFNKRTRLRSILQYVDYRYNSAIYIDEQDPLYRRLFTQLLFSYKINPQTVMFLGYSDNYKGYQHTGLPQVNRTVFLKIGYALVM